MNQSSEFRPKQILIPTVIEKEGMRERAYDIYSRLLKDNIIFIGSGIDDNVANAVIAQMLFLDKQSSDKDIYLYINSPGGSVTAGLAILDTMNHVKADIQTICVGLAASMAAILLGNGASKKRSALPHARIMIHQPWARGLGGQVTDIEIATKEIAYQKQTLIKLLSKQTGQSPSKIATSMERDHWMSPNEASKLGLIDNVLRRSPVKSKKKNQSKKKKKK